VPAEWRGYSIRISPFKAFCGSADSFSPAQLVAGGCAGSYRIILSNDIQMGLHKSLELRARKVR